MIQAQTQTAEYWGAQFTYTDADIEQLYNHFLEVERPQTVEQLTRALFQWRVTQEIRSIRRQAKDRQIYQPQNSYAAGDKLVFPALDFVQGTVAEVRKGFNPEEGNFNVLSVEINGRMREFAADYEAPHPLNETNGGDIAALLDLDAGALYEEFGPLLVDTIYDILAEHPDFVEIESMWFVKSLLLDINVGHLHLCEAILEMNEGGPMPAGDLLVHLDLDPAIDESVQQFSLNYALARDERFEDVGGAGRILWFLRRLEPEDVKTTPGRLRYNPVEYNRSFLDSQLRALEQELDDEWSEIGVPAANRPAILALTYPHRWAGTLPLSLRLRPLFNLGQAPRQRVVFVDETTKEEFVGWVVPEGRYITGLKGWYEENKIPVGGFLHLAQGKEHGTIIIGYDRRRPQREWIRLATVIDNRIQFELKRRSIGCGYDDLMIVGSDVVAAIDAVWRRAEANERTVASLLIEIFPTLASLTPLETVHAKTLYSALNMLRRMPPGPIFAELVSNPVFQNVGDHYWVYDSSNR